VETINRPKRATAKQVAFFKGMHARAGIELGRTRLRRFQSMTTTAASFEIERLLEAFDVHAVTAYIAPTGMASARQLAYFVKLRNRLQPPLEAEELEKLKLLTTTEMQQLTATTMRALQDQNDEHGVPLPAWRRDRGL
jgi:hypothetical protein